MIDLYLIFFLWKQDVNLLTWYQFGFIAFEKKYINLVLELQFYKENI